ncbi:glycosyl hydrolase family 8 [Teichococcus aestuarii]|uniref:glycosyl hydrolase family 8 n=1 Tax=Teichococcus aestuarii TaxID=568898 RepID=UPI0036061210
MPSPFSRRALMVALATASTAGAPLAGALAAMPVPGAPPPAPLLEGWQRFRRAFLRPEGRVVDTGNQGVSHSEGQGWALYCAERCDDRVHFDRIWNWTRQVLSRPQDRLLAWRYMPGGINPVPDRNNAADGDLFIAASLLLAGQRWGRRPIPMRGPPSRGTCCACCCARWRGAPCCCPRSMASRRRTMWS